MNSLESLSAWMSVRKITANLVPYPRLHIMSTSFSPFVADIDKFKFDYSVDKITESLLWKDNYMTLYDEGYYKSISSMLSYWGDVSYSDIVKTYPSTKEKLKLWNSSPTGVLYSASISPFLSFENDTSARCCVGLINNSGLAVDFLERIAHKFDMLYARNAFVFWYVGEGMDSGEHPEAREDLEALIRDYNEALTEEPEEPQPDDY